MKALNLDSTLLLIFIALTTAFILVEVKQLDVAYGLGVTLFSSFVFVKNMFFVNINKKSKFFRAMKLIEAFGKSLFYVSIGMLVFSLEGKLIISLISVLLLLALVLIEYIFNEKENNTSLVDYILYWGTLGFLYGILA